jgi:hypothetical protein
MTQRTTLRALGMSQCGAKIKSVGLGNGCNRSGFSGRKRDAIVLLVLLSPHKAAILVQANDLPPLAGFIPIKLPMTEREMG